MSSVDTIVAKTKTTSIKEVGRKLPVDRDSLNLRRCVSVTSMREGIFQHLRISKGWVMNIDWKSLRCIFFAVLPVIVIMIILALLFAVSSAY